MAPSKVVVIVHGMGNQKRNATLRGTVNSVLELMEARRDPSKEIHLATGSVAIGSHAYADVTYDDETWRFMEYWWAESFLAPSVFRFARWFSSHMISHLGSLEIGLRRSREEMEEATGQLKDPLAARRYHRRAFPCTWRSSGI